MRALACLLFVAAGALPRLVCGEDAPGEPGFALTIGTVEAPPGGMAELPVLAESPVPYQGLSLSVRFSPAEVEVSEVSVAGTILEALRADFIETRASAAEGIFTLAFLVDAAPPFDGASVPAPGFPLEVARAVVHLLRTTPGDVAFEFVAPPAPGAVMNLFAVENRSVAPALLSGGKVQVRESANLVPAFIRGDANADAMVDLGDVLEILSSRFFEAFALPCEAAGDVDVDGGVDITDAIRLLDYLFLDGPVPLPPVDGPGPDPRGAAGLPCDRPLLWLPGRSR